MFGGFREILFFCDFMGEVCWSTGKNGLILWEDMLQKRLIFCEKINFQGNRKNQRKKWYVVMRCEKKRIFEWYGVFL